MKLLNGERTCECGSAIGGASGEFAEMPEVDWIGHERARSIG